MFVYKCLKDPKSLHVKCQLDIIYIKRSEKKERDWHLLFRILIIRDKYSVHKSIHKHTHTDIIW